MQGDDRSDPRPMLAIFALLVIAALWRAVSSLRVDQLLASAISVAPLALDAVAIASALAAQRFLATGHGKWQYVREDNLIALVDAFFGTRVFGPERLEHFRGQASALATELKSNGSVERDRAGDQLADVERRIERQLAAIEAGVDPAVVGERIRVLKAERQEIQTLVSQLDHNNGKGEHLDAEESAAVLDSIPDLSKALKEADPELRRAVFEAFRLRVEIDRNSGLIRLKALVSSAFSQAGALSDIGATKAIAGAGFEPATSGL